MCEGDVFQRLKNLINRNPNPASLAPSKLDFAWRGDVFKTPSELF